MWWTSIALAAGAPRTVVVLYNADVPESLAVAEHYVEARPGAHLCPVRVDPTVVDLPFAEFADLIRSPLDSCLAGEPEISTIVTVRGLPNRVALESGVASLEAVLQVGHAADLAGNEVASAPQGFSASQLNPMFSGGFAQAGDFVLSNLYEGSYQASPGVVREEQLPIGFERSKAESAGGTDYAGELFLVGRLDGFDYDDAHSLIERSIAAEAALPTAPMLCMHGADEARGARDPECEYATRMLALAGVPTLWIDPWDAGLAGHEVMAWMSGADNAIGAIDGNTYAPGAIVDNLTSYGAVPQNFVCSEDGLTCPAAESQTSIARWVRAGATLVHGTVEEPLNNAFPNASLLLFYAAGYSAGESALFAQRFLHWHNLWLGDPMTTPYATRPTVQFAPEVVDGSEFVVTASHPDGIYTLRLWVDGAEVAAAFGEELRYPLNGLGAHEVYAEAAAGNHTWRHPAWPVAESVVRARTAGWISGTVTVTEAEAPILEDTGGDVVEEEEPAGCGCAVGPAGNAAPALIVGLVALAAIRRRGRLEQMGLEPTTSRMPFWRSPS